MNIAAILSAILLLCMPLSAGAHGTGLHVVGTVSTVAPDRLEIEDAKGAIVTVRTTEKTRYRTKNAAATTPQVGDRVVIEAAQEGDMLTAVEVRFASSGPRTRPAR